jgi:hypothetical protein
MSRQSAWVLPLAALVVLVPVVLVATVETWPDGISDGEPDESFFVAKSHDDASLDGTPRTPIGWRPIALSSVLPADQPAASTELGSAPGARTSRALPRALRLSTLRLTQGSPSGRPSRG